MNTNTIPTIGSSADPARATGWTTSKGVENLPAGEIVVTVNDNDQAVYLHLDAKGVHGLVQSLLRFAKQHAPLDHGNDRPRLTCGNCDGENLICLHCDEQVQ